LLGLSFLPSWKQLGMVQVIVLGLLAGASAAAAFSGSCMCILTLLQW
jgi:hypothetical protein